MSGPETSIKASRARLLLVTVGPVLLSLVVASVELSRTSLPELECWVIPSGRIIAVQGWDQCPVESNARLRRIQADDGRRANVDSLEQLQRWFASNTKTAEVRLWTSKDGDEQVYDAVSVTSLAGRDVAARLGSAVLAAIVLMYLPFQLLRQSNSQAAIPLAVHYASISVLVIVVLSGRNSFWLQRIGLLSSIVIPATLAHLTLTFPRVRPIILERPSTVFVPYVLAALLLPAGWSGLERNASVWPAFVFIVLLFTFGAWLVMAVSCGFVMRDSDLPLERARARVLLGGLVLAPV